MRSRYPTTGIIICDTCKFVHDNTIGNLFLPLGWFHLEYHSERQSTYYDGKSLHFCSFTCLDRYLKCVKDYKEQEPGNKKGV